MKRGVTVWLIIIAVSFALAIWQRENLSIVWREYSSLYRHVKREDYSIKLLGPLIPPKIAKEDPEAAAVAEIQLTVWFGQREDAIELIAEKFLEQPDNEFILFELTKSLWCLREDIIDPQIAIRLTERLVALEPDNANYRYIKSCLLLTDRNGNDINAALEEMEHANGCSGYDFPCENYRQRAISITNKAKLSRFLMSGLYYYEQRNPFTYDIGNELIYQANAAFTEDDTAKGTRITDALTKMQACQLSGGDLSAKARLFSWMHVFGYWHQPQSFELQRVNLSKERARKDRLDLCALIIPPKKSEEPTSEQSQRQKQEQGPFQSFAPYPAVHTGRMFIAFLSVCAILLLVSAARGFGKKARIGLVGAISFILGCVYYFCIAQGPFLLSLIDSLDSICSCYYSHYIEAFRPVLPSLGDIIEEEPFWSALFLAGPIAAALVLWGLSFLRPKRGAFWRYWYARALAALFIGDIVACIEMYRQNLQLPGWWKNCVVIGGLFAILAWVIIMSAWWLFRCRMVRLILAATFFGAVTLLLSGYQYINYLPMIVFILVGLIIAVVKPNEGSALKTTLRLLSRKPDVAAVRNKCLRLAAPFIAVYWAIFILLTPIVVKCINLQLKDFEPVDRRLILAEPNEAYQEVISKLEAQNVTKQDIQRLLGLVMPEDLSTLLQKLKQKKFEDYYWPFLLRPRQEISEEEKVRQEQTRQRRQRLNDDDLVLAMRGCGRDVVSIIAGFLDEPDAEQALAARARLGDVSVKERLETLLQTRMFQDPNYNENEQTKQLMWYVDKPLKASEIISALACISEPNEAIRNFLDFVEIRQAEDLIYDSEFFEGLIFLPVSHAQTVIKAYLAKVNDWQPQTIETSFGEVLADSYNKIRPLRRLVDCYGDSQIAEDILRTMLSATANGEEFEAFDISAYWGPQSVGLLRRGLACNNPDMRAWCIWQLRKTGYKFQPEELNKLLTDESWKVRANTAFAGGKDAASIAENDKSAFVRLVATLDD